MELFKYPKNIGKYQDKDVIIYNGKYGYYLKWNQKNYSSSNSEPSLEESIEIIENKVETTNIIKKINEEIIIKKGKYGPYICYQEKKNVNIPKNRVPNDLNEEQCMELIKNHKKK